MAFASEPCVLDSFVDVPKDVGTLCVLTLRFNKVQPSAATAGALDWGVVGPVTPRAQDRPPVLGFVPGVLRDTALIPIRAHELCKNCTVHLSQALSCGSAAC